MKKVIIILFVLALLIPLAACNNTDELNNKPGVDEKGPEIDNDFMEIIGDWQKDSTGHFSYLTIRPSGNIEPFFDDGMVFHENMFIYKTATDPKTGITLYGYMDPEFNILSKPISTSPYVFNYGFTKIKTEDGSYVIDSNFERVTEIIPGFILLGNTVMEVDWDQYVYREPFMITDINTEEYLVPYKIEPGPGNDFEVPLYGYMTLNSFMSDNVPEDKDFIISPSYQNARLFIDGLAAVKQNGKWGFIDEVGNIVFDFEYKNVKSLTHDRVACIWSEPEAPKIWDWWAIFDTEGNKLTPWRINYPDRYVNGFLADGETTSRKIYNVAGEQVTNGWVTHWADGPVVFHEGYVLLGTSLDGNYFYDESFTRVFYVTRNWSTYARNFSDGYAAVKERKKWGYMNLKGERVIPYLYDIATDFCKGYAYVSNGVHIINKQTLASAINPGYLIDKALDEYLKELNLMGITKFNEEGYALGYSTELVEHVVDKNANDANKYLEPEYVTELWEERTYYMIHIENP